MPIPTITFVEQRVPQPDIVRYLSPQVEGMIVQLEAGNVYIRPENGSAATYLVRIPVDSLPVAIGALTTIATALGKL